MYLAFTIAASCVTLQRERETKKLIIKLTPEILEHVPWTSRYERKLLLRRKVDMTRVEVRRRDLVMKLLQGGYEVLVLCLVKSVSATLDLQRRGPWNAVALNSKRIRWFGREIK